jgi:hypothetical protein
MTVERANSEVPVRVNFAARDMALPSSDQNLKFNNIANLIEGSELLQKMLRPL